MKPERDDRIDAGVGVDEVDAVAAAGFNCDAALRLGGYERTMQATAGLHIKNG